MQKLRLKMHADLKTQRQEANAADDKLRAQEDELRSGKHHEAQEGGKGVALVDTDEAQAEAVKRAKERARLVEERSKRAAEEKREAAEMSAEEKREAAQQKREDAQEAAEEKREAAEEKAEDAREAA